MPYQVFVSFRGLDTRKKFIDHLYTALRHAGINTFKDSDNIERGENIKSELKKAIKESKISIIVLSQNYAFSRWCLDELVIIMKQRKAVKHVVLPIFYEVDPSQVRNQTGSYETAFDRHERCFEGEMHRVDGWRAALREVADLGGMELSDRHESQFIKDIVDDIWKKLHQPAQNNIGGAIISRIAGIGKIAKTYNLNSERFQGTKDIDKNDLCDSGGLQNQNVQELDNYAVDKAKDTTESVNNCRRIVENMTEVGTQTFAALQQQGKQITSTHNMCVVTDNDLSRGEKLLNNLGGMFSKSKKTREISGPFITSENSSKNNEICSEHREKLGLVAPAPKGRSASRPTNALQKVEVEKAKQDDTLSDLSNTLGGLKNMAIDMGIELNRQNKALDHLHQDVDELNSRVNRATQRGHRLHGK